MKLLYVHQQTIIKKARRNIIYLLPPGFPELTSRELRATKPSFIYGLTFLSKVKKN
jgi:hypothetical protein